MTITPTTPTGTLELARVAVDLYRDIHKGIRAELFAVTTEAGRIDPGDLRDRAALAAHVTSVVELLVQHAEHEDAGVQPTLEAELPDLAAVIDTDHHALEARMAQLTELAQVVQAATTADQRHRTHQLYVELASFTSAYLTHQDTEERIVMPALHAAIGVDAVLAIHGGIIASIPPDELVRSLALMFPAMNIDDRTELLGGMQATAPPEAFAGAVSLMRSVLSTEDAGAVTARLGVVS
jgi:hypothetical protein